MNRVQRSLAFLSPLALAAVLAGCGSGAQPAASPSSASPSASSSASSSSSGTPTGSDSATPGTGSPAPSTAGGVARCVSNQLQGSLQPGAGGAAGTVYQKIALKNVSQSPCLLEGFAGVSLTNGPTGAPIGAPADRDTSVPVVPIVLQPGQSGAADFGLHQAGNYTGCTTVDAAGYRVYPPEDYGSLFIPAQVMACSNSDIHLLTLRAFQPS
ncbi:hypothetical protein SA2016_0600 [Sinomonas atrocyanea]|uniref:DUF4232 domain-containing protein n=1 Tax=Sinomonas atrocyanea TaxID=37927 RepID=A0A126ZW23_9MICC|nr:DUF4232 domain-containing protein [Sinomonas atrocyanea]AMM31293.1 hypothetical protein SA2016_0600 [Sinomonas atrocyanea]GEB64496.1 hypothetical protein SAT01_19440 [Sinomonas atrocyanea]GGG64546.1 hypothetical protein GCM10007172_14840 [Sinomonas atrocyanea]